jgi:hypothetical protein
MGDATTTLEVLSRLKIALDNSGTLEMSQQYGTMLGGFALNISGPCYRPSDIIKLQFDELTLDCERVEDSVRLRQFPLD